MDMIEFLRDAAGPMPAFWFFEDFMRYDGIVDTGAMDFVAISSGTLATQAANGGWARISAVATTDDTGGQLQASAAHVLTDGKQVVFKARTQLNETTSTNGATESEWYLGLLPVDTSIVASFPADGIYFSKADGGTAIQAIVRVAGANVLAVTIANTADKSVHTYGIGITPNGTTSSVVFTIDGAVVARSDAVASLPAGTVILTPSVAFQTGDATGTKFLDVDYLGSYQQR